MSRKPITLRRAVTRPVVYARSGGAMTEASEAARQVATGGWTVLRGAIEPGLVAELLARIDALLRELAIPFGSNAFLGERTRRIFNLLARDPLFARVPLHPAVLPVAEGVLDRELLLSSLTAIEMQPGQPAQPFHA